MKHCQEYVYEYPSSKEALLHQLNDRRGNNHNYCFGDYLIEIKSDDRFFLGVERGGHSGGYWYVARIEETSAGTQIIRGSIVYNPDEDGNPQKEPFIDQLEYLFLNVVLLPVVLVAKAIRFFRLLRLKLRKEPLPRPEEEVKLDRFMVGFLD